MTPFLRDVSEPPRERALRLWDVYRDHRTRLTAIEEAHHESGLQVERLRLQTDVAFDQFSVAFDVLTQGEA